MPHRSWWVPQRDRAVDKKGVAVALAFLVALGALAGGRGENRDRVEDGTHRATVAARDTSSTSNPTLPGEGAMMDGLLSVTRWSPSISMPYLSGPFKTAFPMESFAPSRTECSTGRPDIRMPVAEAGQRDSGQILRSNNLHWPSLLFQYVTQEGGMACQSPAHPSPLVLMTDNRLSESGE